MSASSSSTSEERTDQSSSEEDNPQQNVGQLSQPFVDMTRQNVLYNRGRSQTPPISTARNLRSSSSNPTNNRQIRASAQQQESAACTMKPVQTPIDMLVFLAIILLFIVTCCGFVHYCLTGPVEVTTEASRKATNCFKTGFELLVPRYGLDPDTRTLLSAAVLDTMQPVEPTDPACILLIGTEDSRPKRDHFARDFIGIVHSAFQTYLFPDSRSLVISGSELGSNDMEAIAAMRHIAEPVAANQSYALLVSDMESLPAGTWSFFHAFCDNGQAVSKRLVMLVTITLPYVDETARNLDVFPMWKSHLSQERLRALDSRLGSYKVLM